MNKVFRILLTLFGSLVLALAGTQSLQAQPGPSSAGMENAVNPLRLSFINGSVSFRRSGAEDWVEARLNIPLAAGDALYTGFNSDLELQGEGRSFIRADDNTQLSLLTQTPDFLQLKVTTGRVGLDLRTLPASGYTIEINTPAAVFTVDRPGYYRVDVNGEVHFITRRGGRAVMTLPGGEGMIIQPSEEIVVRQVNGVARAETYVAPEPNDWDRWNYDRTNYLVDSVSERYLPSGVAGARDLDQYGSWRSTNEYGPVWVPDGVSSSWAPYSAGQWLWDPYYQWTWVDAAPWGWAPYHYGRWVYLSGTWGWAPGPIVGIRRPVYAPALVAFFGLSSNLSLGLSFGSGGLGWVALGWGEPLIPWWGVRGFVGQPYWGGWAGPRMINNTVVRQTNITNITNITYVNTRVNHAIVTSPSDRFGRTQIHQTSDRPQIKESDLQHIRGPLAIKPSSANLLPDAPRASRPPEQIMSRPVVTTRKPVETKLPWRSDTPAARSAEQQPYVQVPKPDASKLRRPEPGTQTGPERPRPVAPVIQAPMRNAPQETAPRNGPPPQEMRPAMPAPGSTPTRPSANETRPAAPMVRPSPEPRQPQEARPPVQEIRPAPVAPRPTPAPMHQDVRPAPGPAAAPEIRQAPAPAVRNLPGEPANRVYRGPAPDRGNQGDRGESRRP